MPEIVQRRLLFRAPRRLFWVAFALRVAAILIGHTYRIHGPRDHFGFAWEAGRIAQSLVTGHGYGNPFNGPSGPTAWLAPLYPLLIALSFKLFGIYTPAAALFLMICDSVFSAAIAPAVYEIAARCFDEQGIARRASRHAAPVALWAGWVWAAYPAFLQYAVHWLWEMSLSTFLFTWTLVFALRLRGVGERQPAAAAAPDRPDAGLRTWAGFGALWGLVGLSNPSLLPCMAAAILWIVWPHLSESQLRRDLRRSVAGVALASAVFVVFLTPWVVRNAITLHAFVPTRANAGAELYQSTLEANQAISWGTTLPLWPGDPEFKRYARMGEVLYARTQGQRAMARIRANPGLFWHYTLDRFLFFWDGVPHPPEPHPALEYLRQLSYSSISAVGLLGLGLMLRRRVRGGVLFALMFLVAPLVYYVITVQPRFRHPIEPLMALLGVYLFRSADTSRVFSRTAPST